MKIDVVKIVGDGIGQELMPMVLKVFDEVLKKAYNRTKYINWIDTNIGESAIKNGELPISDNSINLIKDSKYAIKGPLTTPIGNGNRSYNVALRQILDLYACVRRVEYYPNVPSPLKKPEGIDISIIRENTEDLYMGFEFDENDAFSELLCDKFGLDKQKKYAFGIKPISEKSSNRIMNFAIEYANKYSKNKICTTHKGNIMKFTEGGFLKWCVEAFNKNPVATNLTHTSIITDALFQDIILKPQEFDVIVAPNLTGDYLSDACAALVGGLGITSGVNANDDIRIYEPIHGTAPSIAHLGIANPTAMLNCGNLLFEDLGLTDAAFILKQAIQNNYIQNNLTCDLKPQGYVTNKQFINNLIRSI
jgi:isocitrate dehydrogenase